MDDYMNDFNQRYLNGELENPDSTKFIDSLKYKTPKGKTVYGGGGIMPDIYIPLHMDKNLEYYNQLLNKGLIYQFAFEYTDKNRNSFTSYKNAEDYIRRFNINDLVLNEFTEYAAKNGISKNVKAYAASIDKVKILLKAFIGRNVFDDKGFYPIYLQTDSAFLKAIEQLKKEK